MVNYKTFISSSLSVTQCTFFYLNTPFYFCEILLSQKKKNPFVCQNLYFSNSNAMMQLQTSFLYIRDYHIYPCIIRAHE